MARLQIGNSKEVVAGITKVGGYIIRAVVHVNVIALGRQKEVLNKMPNPKTFAGFVGVKSLTLAAVHTLLSGCKELWAMCTIQRHS